MDMKHILVYRFKAMVRNRTLMFWSLLFPLALMTMFGLVLRSSYTYTEFETIPIAIVDNEAWNETLELKQVLEKTKSGDNALFSIQVVSLDNAKNLLKSEKVDAYVLCGESFDLHVKDSGINQTITQTFFDEYLQKSNMVKQMIMKGATMDQIQSLFTSTMSYVETQSSDNMDMTNVYFYTGLAMSAMFGGMWAVKAIGDIQADQSQKGARISMAPTNKAVHLLCSLILNLVSVFVILSIQFAYIYYLFDVNFESQLPYLLLTLLVGDIAGSSLGAFIGSVISTKDPESKIGLLSSFTMLCSFLAGMMIVNLKWIIHFYVPYINYINPINMITDAMYSLYFFGVGERFYINIISLLIFSVVCYGTSFIWLSKKQYKSLGVK